MYDHHLAWTRRERRERRPTARVRRRDRPRRPGVLRACSPTRRPLDASTRRAIARVARDGWARHGARARERGVDGGERGVDGGERGVDGGERGDREGDREGDRGTRVVIVARAWWVSR